MSRRGTVYDERDYYEERRGPPPPAAPVRTREREYEEIDIYSRRGGGEREREREPDRRPDFLRDDYGRGGGEAGPMVIREREVDTFTRPLERRPRSPSPVRLRARDILRDASPQRSESVRTRTRVVERERRSPSPPPPSERLRARVIETRERVRERSPSPPPPERVRTRIVETRERVRERSPSPIRIRERERIIERTRSLSPPPVERIRVRNFEREVRQPTPSPSPSPSPSPPPPTIRAPPIHQEIITHHRHIDHGFERARVPTPPPPPRRSEPRTKETDIDIYTSRNNTEVDIIHKESAREPPPRERERERRKETYDDAYIYEQERDTLRVADRQIEIRRSASARPERQVERQRGFGLNLRDDDEAEYYARKVDERAYMGEALHGATKDWAIVDVPPGTERVQMEGIGGGGQEITWQKYNGVRRSKFIPERERERERVDIEDTMSRRGGETTERERITIREEPRARETGLEIEISRKDRRPSNVIERYEERIEEVTDRRVALPRAPPKQRENDLWTEITKDLVVREAIEEMGYDFEETEFFYYIIQYLRYEDVLKLVELSEEIRNERQRRIREIERERERMERREKEREEYERRERREREDQERRERRRERERERERERDRESYTDERIIEREVIYDNPPPRRRW